MKLLMKWKYIYWFLVVVFLTYLVIRRLPFLFNGNPTNMDIIVFVIWVALIVAPMFREVSIFGVGLKNEIDSIRIDLKGEMLNLRSEIQNTVNFNPQFYLGEAPADSELPGLREAVQKSIEEVFGTKDIQTSQVQEELSAPTDVQYLFLVRYNLEKELNRVWGLHAASQTEERPRSPGEIMRLLSTWGTIDMDFYKALRDVYTVCNMAIHGRDISQAKLDFVRDVAPQLLAYLESLPNSRPEADI